MGDETIYQPLTKREKVSVLIYRSGIATATILLAAGGFLALREYGFHDWKRAADLEYGYGVTLFILALYISAALSVFTIHLYVKKFRRLIKLLYGLAVLSLVFLLIKSGGHLGSILFAAGKPACMPVLLLPLAGCLGFITAKEAFCFRLHEGFFIAIIMPYYLLLFSLRAITPKDTAYGLILIALLMLIFTVRKIRMPLAYDIGDKNAYEE